MITPFILDGKKEAAEIIKEIKNKFIRAGFSKAVIGLSGGIDSAVSCALAVKALGGSHIYPYLLPYGSLNPAGVKDAYKVCEFLEIPTENIKEVDIKPLVDPIIATDPAMDEVRKGNCMARMRMILLFDAAKKKEALVVGTENKTEHMLGYFTRFGDEASDIEPIHHLYKTQVRQLASFMKVPDELISKAPTAGLWEGQTDEGEFGFTYEEADKILYEFYEKRRKVSELIAQGFLKETINQVIERVMKNAFKRSK